MASKVIASEYQAAAAAGMGAAPNLSTQVADQTAAKANVSAKDKFNEMRLKHVATEGNEKVIGDLISDSKLDLNVAIILAAQNKRVEVVKMLLSTDRISVESINEVIKIAQEKGLQDILDLFIADD